MIIYRLTDRIPVKIEGLTFWISPLSQEQKINLLECRKMEGGKEVVDGVKRALLSIKYALKKVDGLKCSDGSAYQVKLDEDGMLSQASIDEIGNLGCAPNLVSACMALLSDFSKLKLKGVEFDLKGVVVAEKKD